MVKKLLSVLLAMLFLAVTALADGQVIDDAKLFSAQEIAAMQEIIERIERVYAVDIVVLTTEQVPNDYSEELTGVRDYADAFYDNGGYGMGEDDSGMLILLDMNNRVIWLSTCGGMIWCINDSREEAILDAAFTQLGSGRFGAGIMAALSETEKFLALGVEEDTFLYDEAAADENSGGIPPLFTVISTGLAIFLTVCTGGDLAW